MADKRLLYFTATRVAVYRWAHARLAVESSFANNEDGAQAFGTHLRGVPASLFYVVVDIVEEDFHQENVPFVRGADRKSLLARKLAQRYRDTSLSLALSLGYEKTTRRDERILFSSFTNNAPFQPWLAALRDQDAAVAGIYSVALLAAQLAHKMAPKKAPLLLVTLQQAGLRQSYVENGKIRFSRLGPLDAADANDPDRVAEAFDRETTRVYQYLTAMRVLAPGSAIDALLVAPPGEKRRVQGAGLNLPQVRASVIELGEAARAIGLREFPDGSGAEVLFLHLLAQRPPAAQYASENLRQYYRLHQLRVGLVAGGAVLCLLGLLYAGVQLAQLYNVDEQITADRQRARVAADSYRKVTAGFPKLPTTTDNLRVTMQKYEQLTKQTSSPDRLAVQLSRVLDRSPKIEVDRIRWELTPNPKARITEGESVRPRTPVTGQPAGPAQQTLTLYEMAEITGRVTSVRSSDPRNVNLAVEEFVSELKKGPAVEVIQAKLPFEIDSQTSLKGDIGKPGDKPPFFKVIVARKLGS